MTDEKRPEWFEEASSDQFTSFVKKGIENHQNKKNNNPALRFKKKKNIELTIEELAEGVQSGSRTILAKAITLIESNAEHHFKKAQELLQLLLPKSGGALRIGITGVPGAGKSTFIEAFGTFLCKAGHRVAVLAVDPSSSISGGSILGDKTRMEQLAGNPKAFIRPSPSGGKLGGVHRKTRETMLLCEAAGFDVILVETVGVGQSEVIVRDMVDFFMLLVLTGAGDELQGMKKGIMELADAVIVNKADGLNKDAAEKTRHELNRILHFLQPATRGWATRAYTCSSINFDSMPKIWGLLSDFKEETTKTGVFKERRRMQSKEWINSMITDQLQMSFFHNPEVKRLLPMIENEVLSGTRPVASGVDELFNVFLKSNK
ncbi:methylmalonyl Co-A mutase-associated GTPase MeaB [Mesobacillus harenae]|uniref:methylmalonyl Co-A mutase-associated GTPase MeaB n=1 Tax=Mesobacillus harenae TaxID=2213203 RepID=UPI00158076CA|nr:methylmalonyl Co-A mutase-associated GTPase MeaB [Mesobacillus harenae]